MILDEIVAHKRQEIAERKSTVPVQDLKAHGADRPKPLDLTATLRRAGVQLIAEVKKASPSKGAFQPDLDPIALGRCYAANGAAAISVLTDSHFFQGKLDDLSQIRRELYRIRSPLPLLRKDFILDPYQVYEAYAHGADALLLIVAALSDTALRDLFAHTVGLGMTALVEVHNKAELERALPLDPPLLGVNNRNLNDFSVDPGIFGRLRPLMPEHAVAVAESGVHTVQDVSRLAQMGADAVLVGEALVTAADTATQVRALAQAGAQARVSARGGA